MFNPPKDLSKVYDRAENFITIDKAMGSLKLHMRTTNRPRNRDMIYNPRSETQPRKETRNGSVINGRPPFPNRSVNRVYTPLNTDRARILEEIRDKPFFKLCPVSNHPTIWDQSQFVITIRM